MAVSKKKKTAATKTSPVTARDKARAAKADDHVRFLIDENGTFVYVSAAMCAAVGLREQDVMGQNFRDFIVIDGIEHDRHVAGMFGVRKTKSPFQIEDGQYGVRIQKGPDHYSKTSTFSFFKISSQSGYEYVMGFEADDDGGDLDKTNFAQKIEVESILQKALETERARKISAQSDDAELRHFLNMSNDLMAISVKGGLFSRVNTSFNHFTGYSDEELRKMTFMDLVHPEDKSAVHSCLHGLLHDEEMENRVIDFEARITAKNGDIRSVEWRQKRFDKIIYTVGRDVTDIKMQQNALRRQQQMLSEAQAIGHMGHWRWVVGAEEISWSDEIYRIFGVDKDQFFPTMDNVNAMLHKRDVGRMMQAFQRAMIGQNNYEMDFRLVRPDGEVRYILCEGKCELDEDGDVTALFGIMQDITERTQYEQQLKEAKDAAERAYAAKSQFLANMSHELRTPLNAIIGFSEMMQRQLLGPIGTDKYLDYIAGIRESGEHLLDLISDILDMSKIEAGKYELDLEELNLSKVIRLAVHMMEGRAQDAKIKVDIDIANEDLQIVADRRALMQILLNLLSNAVKFTNPGGHVRIECLERDDYISLKVHDTGIGIPANKLKCITHPFEQAASHYTREHEGTGLGLSITKDLIELHGGSLHIESSVGIGTSVSVRLPYDAHVQNKKRKKA